MSRLLCQLLTQCHTSHTISRANVQAYALYRVKQHAQALEVLKAVPESAKTAGMQHLEAQVVSNLVVVMLRLSMCLSLFVSPGCECCLPVCVDISFAHCAELPLRQLRARRRNLREGLPRRPGLKKKKSNFAVKFLKNFNFLFAVFSQMDIEMKTNLLAAYVSAGLPEKAFALISKVTRNVSPCCVCCSVVRETVFMLTRTLCLARSSHSHSGSLARALLWP